MTWRQSGAESRAADLLAEHVLTTTSRDGCFCACGLFSVGRGPQSTIAHAAHVAQELYDAGMLE